MIKGTNKHTPEVGKLYRVTRDFQFSTGRQGPDGWPLSILVRQGSVIMLTGVGHTMGVHGSKHCRKFTDGGWDCHGTVYKYSIVHLGIVYDVGFRTHDWGSTLKLCRPSYEVYVRV